MVKKLKILHCPADVGGQAWMVSRAERMLGYHSDNMIFASSCFGYPADYNLNFKKETPLVNFSKALIFFLKALKKYNVFHFYYARSILPFCLDIPILRISRKKVFFTFQGCDIRRKGYCLEHFKINACKECKVSRCKRKLWDLLKLFRLKIAVFFANKTFVLNSDLKVISPSSEMLPYANIDLDKWQPLLPKENSPITILHAPTDRDIKGTRYIIKAVSKLRGEGNAVKLKLAENIKHNQMREFCLDADIIIDQLLVGWYGGFAVEMMALQKPVICYLNEDLFPLVPWAKDIPIVNTKPDELYENLRWLINNPDERTGLGKEGRKFVEKYHDPIKIAKQLINHYEQK